MKETVDFTRFCDAFRDMDLKENFSYEGQRALFDYLEEYEESAGEELELDVIALCCDYHEESAEEIAANYNIGTFTNDDEELAAVREYLEENTIIVGEVPGGFVYAAF